MATCPSCGRYVGPTDAGTCSHCGARLTGRVTIRALRIGGLVLAMLGLGLLWWFATHSPVTMLKIGQAQALTLDVMDVASRAVRSVPLNDVERLLLDGVDQAWLAYHPSGRDLLFESMVLLVLNMHCRFCPDCDLLIVHQDELEAQLAAHMAERDPSIIANEYIVIGTVERAALDKLAAGTQGFDPVEIQAAVEKMVKGKTGHQSTQDWLSDDIKRKLKRPKKK